MRYLCVTFCQLAQKYAVCADLPAEPWLGSKPVDPAVGFNS
jgi:hypothetical protein